MWRSREEIKEGSEGSHESKGISVNRERKEKQKNVEISLVKESGKVKEKEMSKGSHESKGISEWRERKREPVKGRGEK